ncbi:hypothetical protein WOLCODRAFT_73267 [Wolfiporia cocos MD-104 SS10]|uniref:Sodium/calcium exchanger membrane region domain-containing protein n=1 Tax=Wolfiporia cocos (strain MD-104) TaxID=742152 RepID=A0A2H3JX12_WOLCO|nr:hypothetical protein WOLCODRAFT_73267 [Wolfiporia cocos MD-104 SS10]
MRPACMLAMIPLVKLHDLAISVMSRRIGGSKTGLLNASFVLELVVAIIALRKCELRVVQSSLVGSILSKLLLILGMCFFAGGMRFSQQDFNTTATQIHSSLLSISVGAVCLPAAFHFALSYNTQDATAIGTTMDQQKADLLKMSHSVSLLLSLYISYLLFQLWSHTHLYEDSTVPSDKLPVAVSMRSMTERVRQKSNSLRSRRSHSQASSFRSAYSKQTLALTIDDRIAKLKEKERTSPVEEAPETSFSHFGAHALRAASGSPDGASARGRTALLLSPSGTASQVRLSAGEFGERADADATIPRSVSASATQRAASPQEEEEPELSWITILILLTIVTLVTINSEWLVDSMDSLSPTLSKEWIGLILLPIVSSIAECVTAVNVSVKDQLTLSISVAVGSTIQTALFVIPLMVILGWILDKPLALLFDPFETVVPAFAVHIMGNVVADGKSNWLEGVILICLYLVIAVTFWFYPGVSILLLASRAN